MGSAVLQSLKPEKTPNVIRLNMCVHNAKGTHIMTLLSSVILLVGNATFYFLFVTVPLIIVFGSVYGAMCDYNTRPIRGVAVAALATFLTFCFFYAAIDSAQQYNAAQQKLLVQRCNRTHVVGAA